MKTIHPFCWYVFRTYPRAEKIAYHELLQNGYDVFLPAQKTLRIWKNRQKKMIDQILFPGYIFVKTELCQLYNILKLSKIVSYIQNEKKPSIICQKEIDGIKIMLSQKADISVESVFTENEKIRITSGPFSGYEGIIVERKGKKKFGIHIEVMNQIVFIELNEDILGKTPQNK